MQQHHNSDGEIVTIVHIWTDTELVTLILGVNLDPTRLRFSSTTIILQILSK